MSVRSLCAVLGTAGLFVLSLPISAPADETQDALIVETILRLDDFDLASSEKAQAAVSRYLKNNWAGERYLDLVRRFKLKDESVGVLRLALEKADMAVGIEAAAALIQIGAGEELVKALEDKDAMVASRAAKAISNAGDPTLLTALDKVLAESSRPAAVRSAALTGIYGTSTGKQAELLAIVKAGKLADDLKQTASEVLTLSRDPKVREEAQSLFAVNEGAYPAVSELVKRKGDLARGAKLFTTKTCIVCHQAGEVGTNFGP
jgi:HEAT repeat protein